MADRLLEDLAGAGRSARSSSSPAPTSIPTCATTRRSPPTPVVPRGVVRPATTDEVAADRSLARRARLPVTARGSGTGLSGACIPRPDGGSSCLRAAWRRSSRSTPTTTSPWCSPASRSTSSTRPPRPHGLVYPVFPGENSASLGGNVATNAGGMRAVKYGVTRHQVLGLEAVLGTGEVIRTGGKFVKATSGYDLTQLIIGSEGTLALVTEAIAPAPPAARPRGDGAGPVRDARRGDRRGAADRRQRRRPADPRVHRPLTMAAIDTAAGLELGIPAGDQGRRARLPRRRARGPRATTGSTRTSRALAELLADLGALDVYVLPAGGGARSSSRRGRRRSGRPRPAAPTTSSTWSCPARASPSTWPRSASSRRDRVAGSSGAATPATATSTSSVFQSDPACAARCCAACSRPAWRSAARSRASTASAPRSSRTSPSSRTRPSSTLMRRIKAAFDPDGHPQPRRDLLTSNSKRTHHERRPGTHPHARRLPASTCASRTPARRRCTSSPRSTRCPRCAACSRCSRASPPARPTATGAWPTSRPPRCCTSARASATAWPTCTTPAGRTRRSSTSSATTPRTTSSTTPRSSPTSSASPARVGLDRGARPTPDDGRGRCRRRGRRRVGPPGRSPR